MDAVLNDATIHQRRQTLHKMTGGFGLDDAYSTTLDRIRGQGGNRVKLGMEALMWISCSERPLKADELCHALAVEVGTTDLNTHNTPSIRTFLSCTLGLVTIDEQSSTVRLVHFTLQEYLAAHPNVFITPHSMMAEICLTYLNFQSICELSIPLDNVPSGMPLLHYASCYWGFHAKKHVTESVKELALQLLRRDANHISADILLSAERFDFLDWEDRYFGRHPDLRGFTGVHCIAYMGVTEIAIAMVGMKAWDLNARDSKGATPLIWALKYGNPTLARLLLEQGDVDPTVLDNQGLTPLAHAAKAGHQDLVELLLQRGNVHSDSSHKYGRTPLSYAAQSGHEGIVKILLERGDVISDSSDIYGRTPLSYAAGSGHEGVVKILLEQGDVNSDSSDGNGRTPLSYAAQSGPEGIVKILLEQGDVNSDSSDKYGRTPLSYAAQSGSEGIVKILLGRGDVNSDSSDGYGRTPLSYAAQSGYEGIVKILLERGDVNSDSSDKCGRTPLSYAAQSGHEGIVKILLERGDVNSDSSGKDGRTPLSYAAGWGHEGIVKMLLERQDVNSDSSDGDNRRTPLSYAAEEGHEGIVRILLGRGDVDPDSSDNYGLTPLHHAQYARGFGVVKLLSEPRPSSHKPSQTSDLILKVSSPSTSPHEEEEPSPVSQQQGILPDIRDDIKKSTPPPPPDQFPFNQLLASHQAPAPAPIPALRSTPASAISKNSRPSKAIRQILRNAKRKLFPPS